MRKTLFATLAVVAIGLTAVAANAQPAPAPAAASAKISVEKTTVGEIIKNPQAKAVLEKALPEIAQYYDQVGSMTLADIAPMSQGALDDAKLKAIQAEFDKLN
jgi:hypothetical protein